MNAAPSPSDSAREPASDSRAPVNRAEKSSAGGIVRQSLFFVVALVLLGGAGYSIWKQLQPPVWEEQTFHATVASNAPEPARLLELPLISPAGQPVDLKQRLGKGPLVVVVTRGYLAGLPADGVPRMTNQPGICVYCATQTAELAAQAAEFTRRGAELMVVFPVRTQNEAQELTELYAAAQEKGAPAAEFPFPVALDVELAAVDRLGIRSQLAQPSAYIMDAQGKVRLAYVGTSAADRPSAAALLARLDQLQQP